MRDYELLHCLLCCIRCKSLDCIAVVECLRDKLNSDSNQTILVSL